MERRQVRPAPWALERLLGWCAMMAFTLSLFALASGCGSEPESDLERRDLSVAPTDVTGGQDDALFVSSASAGVVLRSSAGTVHELPERWIRPYGLVTTVEGRLCLAHFTSDDPLTRQSAVSCREGDTWTREATGLGSGVNGLLATAEGLWAIGWQDTDVEQRDGRLSLIVDGGVAHRIDVSAYLPRFATETPSGELLVSAWREDASGFTAGSILRVTREGDVDAFSDALDRPAGLAYADEGVWVTDTAAGALVLLSHDGRERARHEGLAEPTGVTLVGSDRICLAETAANRITCLDLANVLGGSQ